VCAIIMQIPLPLRWDLLLPLAGEGDLLKMNSVAADL